MALTPIGARCRRCGNDFYLFELLEERSGTCPRCGWVLTADWTAHLLDQAARADIAQRHLVSSLRNLRNLPGNVTLRPHIVLRNLFEEVGWQEDLVEEPEMLREELRELRRLLIAWELVDPVVAAAQPDRGILRRIADWFMARSPEPVLPIASALEPATAEPHVDPDRDLNREDRALVRPLRGRA